jgi:hypothetical protein
MPEEIAEPSSIARGSGEATRAAANSALRASAKKASRRSSSNFVLGGVLLTMLLGGFALVVQYLPTSASHSQSSSSSVRSDPRVGTVTFSSDGDNCRRMVLDNKTGQMVEIGSVRCAGSPPSSPEEAMQQRYSGGRLDAIRKSFSGR